MSRKYLKPFSENFLFREAIERGLTNKEIEAFLASLSGNNNSKSLPEERDVASDILHIELTTLRTRFTGIYKKYQMSGGPGRFLVLYHYLRNRYEQHGRREDKTQLQMFF